MRDSVKLIFFNIVHTFLHKRQGICHIQNYNVFFQRDIVCCIYIIAVLQVWIFYGKENNNNFNFVLRYMFYSTYVGIKFLFKLLSSLYKVYRYLEINYKTYLFIDRDFTYSLFTTEIITSFYNYLYFKFHAVSR